ncbi:hypothetical protein, partial [Burkholderia sp. Ac-20349]|uniref:hypothetical protein n=1 Tax=Burkholderia sp. Ac-20349 TaxID=2703893 RepID=UPI001F11F349
MRHFLLGWLLAAVVSAAQAATPAPAAASAASGTAPAMTSTGSHTPRPAFSCAGNAATTAVRHHAMSDVPGEHHAKP